MGCEISGNTKTPSVLVIGVVHGDEPQGRFLIEKYLEGNPITDILFVPSLNDSLQRVNANGVDLNRNFPTKNWELTEKDQYYGGPEPASEVETKFLIELVEKYEPKVILTIHSPYKIVNYDGANSEYGLEIVNKVSEIIRYPVEASIGYPTPGSFGTWAGVEKGILTITLELDEEADVEDLKLPVFEIFKYLETIK